MIDGPNDFLVGMDVGLVFVHVDRRALKKRLRALLRRPQGPASPRPLCIHKEKKKSKLALLAFFFRPNKATAPKASCRQSFHGIAEVNMPAKRRYGESLTGGTGDVNPQTYTIVVDNGSVTGNGTKPFPVPIPRYPGTATRAVVMEILKVEWSLPGGITTTGANGDGFSISATLATNGTAGTNVGDSTVFSSFRRNWTVLNASLVGFQIFSPSQEEDDDLTDGAGHGYLVATDTIYLSYNQTVTNWIVSSGLICKVFYRMKEVGLTEYIGIVQSQQ